MRIRAVGLMIIALDIQHSPSIVQIQRNLVSEKRWSPKGGGRSIGCGLITFKAEIHNTVLVYFLIKSVSFVCLASFTLSHIISSTILWLLQTSPISSGLSNTAGKSTEVVGSCLHHDDLGGFRLIVTFTCFRYKGLFFE